jgi:hypothetical protein
MEADMVIGLEHLGGRQDRLASGISFHYYNRSTNT